MPCCCCCCCCTHQPLPPAQGHCSESAHLLSEAASAGTGSSVRATLSGAGAQTFHFHSYFFITAGPSPEYPSCSLCICSLCPPPPRKVRGSCDYPSYNPVKAHFKNQISPFCNAAASPAFLLLLLLFALSISHASQTDEQMLPRDRFHINDYWLLTPNEPLLSDQCRISLLCRSHLSRAESRGWGFPLNRGTSDKK